MVRKIITALFLFVTAPAISQSIDKEKLFRLADSVVLSNTNSSFLKSVQRDSIIHIFKYVPVDSTIDLSRLDRDKDYYEKLEQTELSVQYVLKGQRGQTYHVKHITGGFGPALFTIHFDKSYNIKKIPKDFAIYQSAATRLSESTIIEKEKAVELASKSFSEKTRDSRMPLLVYDSTTDKLYWRITRHKGFKNVIEEHVMIDANTSLLLGKQEQSYYRSFWQSIGDFFTGHY